MSQSRRQLSTSVKAFVEDYKRAKLRIAYLNSKHAHNVDDEFESLTHFVKCIDDMVLCFPEIQQIIFQKCILDDLPVTKAALEIGYHYTWVLELRDRVVKALECAIHNDGIITSEMGLKLKEVIDGNRLS